MNLLQLVQREFPARPWAEGEKIPWNETGFSQRMLREHLSQAHDAASRRFEIIDQHVAWIHTHLLGGKSASVLDLGCGPGLYTQRLARRGHHCYGIDFSPASIEYARQQAVLENLSCGYRLEDVRQADFGKDYDLVMFLFGEINVFRPAEAHLILQKACAALRLGGMLVLEPQSFEAVRGEGQEPARWYSAPAGLFSDQPHLCLTESFWEEDQQVTTNRYYIVDAGSAEVTRWASTTRAYTAAQMMGLLSETGFAEITFYSALAGEKCPLQENLFAVTARRVI